MRSSYFFLLAGSIVFFSSCVPQRKYTELDARKKSLESENVLLKNENEQFEAQVKEMTSAIATKDLSIQRLTDDTAMYGKNYRQLRSQYDKILELNDNLTAKNEAMLKNASTENQKLLTELNKAQDDLKRKEDVLKQLEKTVNEKQAAVEAANANLQNREAQLRDMKDLLKAQEDASQALKEKISAALLGFKDKGLSVREEQGKVYVSMEAKLLFASGSTAVDPNGKRAVIDLAKAIENDVDMEVIVEGHTDTDKINSSSIPRDNWELSVLRATEVVKIMITNSKIKPAVLSASGRSEYHPVSSVDKAKNRRIEIILQPNLDELYKIIEGRKKE